jgi:hypothetical protein
MRQVKRTGLITVAAAGGVLAALSGGTAYADAGAQGATANSPGVLSGNGVQLPVHVPVNVCGNTVTVVGLLNPATGNACGHAGSGTGQGSGAHASGTAQNSPGVGSGNGIQLPIDVPANVCGNTVTAGGLLNPSSGNACETGSGRVPRQNHRHPDEHHKPQTRHPVQHEHAEIPAVPAQHAHHASDVRAQSKPQAHPQAVSAHKAHGELAHTGAGFPVGTAAPAGAALLLGGVVLYRRGRAMRR